MSSVLPVIIDTPIPEITEDTEVFDLEDLNENNLNMEINDNEESEEEIIPEEPKEFSMYGEFRQGK